MSFVFRLRELGACLPAIDWVGDRTLEQAWAECTHGEWMLWYLQRVGVNTREAAFWCTERARQSALAALPSFPGRDRLAACAPIVDIKTAQAAEAAAQAAIAEARVAEVEAAETAAQAVQTAAEAAAETAEWAGAAAGAAAWAAAGAAGAAGAAAREVKVAAGVVAEEATWVAREEVREEVRKAELSTIADYVRANYKLPEAQL